MPDASQMTQEERGQYVKIRQEYCALVARAREIEISIEETNDVLKELRLLNMDRPCMRSLNGVLFESTVKELSEVMEKEKNEKLQLLGSTNTRIREIVDKMGTIDIDEYLKVSSRTVI